MNPSDINPSLLILLVIAVLVICFFIIVNTRKHTKELNEEKSRKRLILDSVGDGIFSVDPSGITTMINAAGLSMLGYSEEEFLGRHIHKLINHTKEDKTPNIESSSPIFRSFKLGETCYVDDTIFWRRSGIILQVEYTSTPIINQDGKITGAVVAFKDISFRKAAEANLKDANKKLQYETTSVNLLQKITTSINEAVIVEDAMLVCIKEICNFIGWELGHAYIYNKETKSLKTTGIWHGAENEEYKNFIEKSDNVTINSGAGLVGKAFASGQPIWTNSSKELVHTRYKAAQKIDIKSAFAIPILVKKEAVAVLEFFSLKKIDPDKQLLSLLGNIGTQLGRVVERKRSEEKIAIFNDHLQELVEERTKELMIATKEAQSANKAKTEFLANISHELRTPMHAILSYSDLGIRKVDNAPREKLSKFLTAINDNGKRLLSLLDVLLDLSKLEAGHMEFHFENNDMHSLIENVTTQLHALAQNKKIIFDFVEDSHEYNMHADMDVPKISQVIWNILSNAIKFSPENSNITIAYEKSTLEINHREVEAISLIISDCGVGIPEDELETVFDKFIQSSKTKTGAGGTGLGLSVSKQIIERHGGRIWAENNIDKGASFTFTIPVEQDKKESTFRI